VVTISAGHALHDTYGGFLAPLLPTFIDNLVLSNTQAGLLTIFLRWPSLFQPIIGHMADRFDVRVPFILAPTVTAAAMSLMGIAPSYFVLAALLVVSGFSSSGFHATGPAIAGKLSGRKLGRGLGIWMVGGELGRTLGPLVIVTAVQLFTLRGTPWLMIFGPLTSLLLYSQLKGVARRPVSASAGLPWRSVMRTMGPFLLPLLGVIVARAFMVASMSTYLPILLTEEGADLWFSGIALAVFQAAGVVGALLGGTLSDRLGRRWIIFASMLLAPLLMFVFLAVDGWVQFPILLPLGLTTLSIMPVIMAMMQDQFPENRALATGVFMALSFGVSAVVVVILGLLGDQFGMRTAFVVSGGLALLGLPFVFWLPNGKVDHDAGKAAAETP
jgi:FSR family fosmidomycin resistance protein-like MFS transporter